MKSKEQAAHEHFKVCGLPQNEIRIKVDFISGWEACERQQLSLSGAREMREEMIKLLDYWVNIKRDLQGWIAYGHPSVGTVDKHYTTEELVDHFLNKTR